LIYFLLQAVEEAQLIKAVVVVQVVCVNTLAEV
jgi:hypothetical protein